MPVVKVTNSVQDKLGELRKAFHFNTKVDTRNEVIEALIAIFEQLKRLKEKHNLKTIEEVLERCDDMNKKEIEEIDPINEIRNNKLDLQSEKLSEIKESLSLLKDLIKQTETNLRSELKQQFTQKETNSKLDALQLNLRTVSERLSELKSLIPEPQPQQEPILDSKVVQTLTEIQHRWDMKNLSEVVVTLIQSYYTK